MTLSLKLTILMCALSVMALAGADGKCRALVFASTTDAGAYHAGVLDGMLKNAKDLSEFNYDFVLGSSVGALNAAVFSQFPNGQETQAAQALMDLWTTITRDDVYQSWAGGYVEGLLFQTSLVDSSPFAQYLQKKVKAPFQRKTVIGASDANTGIFVTWNETNLLSTDDLVQALMASTAIPLYFPYINWGQSTYIDGSLIIGADIEDAIDRCFEIVSNQEDIIIDVISSHNHHPKDVYAGNYNTLQVLQRALEILLYGMENFQYYLSRLDYPKVNFRYFIQPSKSLPGTFSPYGFDPENIATDIAIGQKDGAAAVATGKLGTGMDRVEEAVAWLQKNHGMFFKGGEKIKAIHQSLREKYLAEEF